jgi:AcrR family transcriptional regulator
MSLQAPETGKRERTKAANRAAILEAGREVFGEMGYGAASVRDIIRRTDLAAGTFYNYFPDKESIFRALVDEMGSEARRRVAAARAGAGSPRAFVEDAYRAYFEFIVEDPATFAFMKRNVGAIRALFDDDVIPAATGDLADDLRAAIRQGDLPAVDVDYCAHAMVAVGVELGARLLERHPPDVEGATRFAGELFLSGIVGLARR